MNKPVQVMVGASQSGEANVVNEADVRTTVYAYGLSASDTAGWTHRTAVRTTTVVPGGTNVVRETVLDAGTGLVKEQRQPSAAGQSANAGTRVTTYYSGSAAAPCNNAAFVNLACTVGLLRSAARTAA